MITKTIGWSDAPLRIVITGAAGNLGRKLISAFASAAWCKAIIAVDRVRFDADADASPKLVAVQADLADRADRRWIAAIHDADVIVHLAARNPYPDASWMDSIVSFDMTVNLLGAAEAAGVRRFVFLSSNHVMGGYKDLVPPVQPGGLSEALIPMPGTRIMDPQGRINDSPAYAVHKLMGERLCRERAIGSQGRLTTISLRVGWCQPGENDPRTLNASGIPGNAPPASEPALLRDHRWFRAMWLSNADFVHIAECAVLADPADWPAPAIVVNAMSDNAGMAWSLADARRLVGYAPAPRITP